MVDSFGFHDIVCDVQSRLGNHPCTGKLIDFNRILWLWWLHVHNVCSRSCNIMPLYFYIMKETSQSHWRELGMERAHATPLWRGKHICQNNIIITLSGCRHTTGSSWTEWDRASLFRLMEADFHARVQVRYPTTLNSCLRWRCNYTSFQRISRQTKGWNVPCCMSL